MLFVGVIFDMADVLYDATLWRRWLLRLVNQLGVPAEYEPFYHAWDHDYLADVHCGRRDYTEAFQTFLLARGLTWACSQSSSKSIFKRKSSRSNSAGSGISRTLNSSGWAYK